MDTNVLDWLEVTAAACPDKPAFLDRKSTRLNSSHPDCLRGSRMPSSA